MAQTSRSADLTSGPMLQKIILFSIPLAASSILQLLFNAADVVVVGRFAGSTALAAVGSNGSLINLLVNLFVGLSLGANVVAARCFGAKDERGVQNTVQTSVTLGLVSGVLLAVVGFFAARGLLELMSCPEDVIDLSALYLKIYFIGMPMTMLYNFSSALLRAVGDTRGPAVIIASGCLVNAVLDVIFVAVLHMEALGCGIAVALTICSNATMIVIRMMHAPGAWRLSLSKLGIDPGICKSMISCGLPLGFQSAAYSISNVLIQVSVNSFGADVTTAWGLSGRLDGIVWMVTEALGVSITTFSAQNFGARNYERMRKGYHTSLVLSFMLIGGLSAVLLVFSGPLSRLFVDDASISAYTTTILHFIAPFYAIYSIIENASGSIRGAGVSLQPMLLTIFGTVVLRVIWVFAIMPFDPSLEHLLLVYPVTWLITATMFTIYHHSGNWLRRATAS